MEEFANISVYLDQASREFIARVKEHVSIKDSVDIYLKDTAVTKWSRSQRLVVLAHASGFSWAETRAVVECILETDSNEEKLNTISAFECYAFNYWLQPASGLTLEEQIEVANKTQSLLLMALQLSPRQPSLALSLGTLYSNHPLIPTKHDYYVGQAFKWFSICHDWLVNYEFHSDVESELFLTVANFHFRLGQWQAALDAYLRLNLQDSDKASHKFILENIDICRERLSKKPT